MGVEHIFYNNHIVKVYIVVMYAKDTIILCIDEK
jgi:hypothetical protein